jgi:glycosyltransferase involved in cell wall biosynthesis
MLDKNSREGKCFTMRICLLGEFKGLPDEGMRKTSMNILRVLKKKHEVLALDLRDITNYRFWSSLKDFDPEIVHYLHGASFRSFIVLQMVSKLCPRAKKIISVMQPPSTWDLALISITTYKPDLLLVPFKSSCRVLERFSIKTKVFPLGGVDVDRFTPRAKEDRALLREKYGLRKDWFLILCVGHIKKERNLLVLKELQKEEEDKVIIVGSTSVKPNKKILKKLEEAGCIIWRKFLKSIEEVYAMSDCFVFPTFSEKNAIQLPLSVLEAMACNLPVITTKFGALPYIFNEGDGLFFAEKIEDFVSALHQVKEGHLNCRTREKVLPYSWEIVVKRLENIYREMLESERVRSRPT